MISWLASYARSGNTYLRVLLHHYYGIPTYNIYDDVPVNEKDLGTAEVTGFRPRPLPLAEMAAVAEHFFVKTHELPADEYPAIYLVRDGRDCLVSYAHFILRSGALGKDGPAEDTPDAFRNTLHDLIYYKASFGGWPRHVLAWTGRAAPTAVIKFEDVVSRGDPLTTVQAAIDEIRRPVGAPVRTSSPPSFTQLHEISDRLFRRGKIGAWRDEMPPELVELFWQENLEAMKRIGYGTQT